MQINRYAKLKEFKLKLMEKFWLEPDKIDLLTKGQFLKNDEKMLKDLNIAHNQTIMILEKNVEEENWAAETQQNNLLLLKDIFAGMDDAFLAFVLKECDDKIDDAIDQLSDDAKKEEFYKKFKRGAVDIDKTFVKDTFKGLFIDKFSSIEFYRLVFKIASLKLPDIQTQALGLIKLLKPNPVLVQNIDAFIGTMRGRESDLTLSKDGAYELTTGKKTNSAQSEDILSFDLHKIVLSPTPLNIYKLEIFAKLVRICYAREEESKFDKKFEFQNKFIDNNGISLLQNLYIVLSEDYKARPTTSKTALLELLSAILSDYTLAYYLINSQDPHKKTKQIFYHRDKSVKKDSYMNITLKKNYSTDNVFSQNANVSFKTNKSPKSFATPGFQSPSQLTRPVALDVLEVDRPADIQPRARGRLLLGLYEHVEGELPRVHDEPLHQAAAEAEGRVREHQQ